jgi:eukaryotic-like serine/threonine-protein kinase
VLSIGRSRRKTTLLEPGARFGRYELEHRIGRGGMGEVWGAIAHGPGGFQKRVVLKMILPEHAHSESYVEMLINEASLSARLNHPNIVQVFELGIERGVHFIAMEHLSGRTFGQVLSRSMEREVRLPLWVPLEVVALCCDGLAYAHDLLDDDGEPLGLLHHDLSPGNVMVSFAGRVTILDFGIAVATKFADPRSRTLQGKYAYMAPERVRGLPADRRSDLYSLGVILYAALAYRRPFEGATDADLLKSVLESTPPPPSAWAPWIDADLDDLVMRAMARDPHARFASADELGRALRAYLRGRGITPTQVELAEAARSLFCDAVAPAPPTPAPIPKSTPFRPLPNIPRARVARAVSPVAPDTNERETASSAIEVDLEDLLDVAQPADARPPAPPVADEASSRAASLSAESSRSPSRRPLAAVGDLFDAAGPRLRAATALFPDDQPAAGASDPRDDEGDHALAQLFSRAPAGDPSLAWSSPRGDGADDLDP